jgi:hypothetical protein
MRRQRSWGTDLDLLISRRGGFACAFLTNAVFREVGVYPAPRSRMTEPSSHRLREGVIAQLKSHIKGVNNTLAGDRRWRQMLNIGWEVSCILPRPHWY